MWWSSIVRDAPPPVVLGLILLATIVAWLAPRDRRATWVKLLLFGLCLIGVVLAALLDREGLHAAAEATRGLSVLGEGLCIISLLGTATFRVILPHVGIVAPRILHDVMVAATFGIWLFIALRMRNVDLTSLIATSAVVTAVIGFSLQDTLGNILGGIAIQFDQSIRVGDWIKTDDVVGHVVEIRWRYTAIETRNWETVVVPNSVLVKNRFAVLGRRQGERLKWRRWVWFNVDYRFDPARVIETATAAIRAGEIPNVAQAPEPNCVVMEYAESFGRYALRYWLTDLAADDTTDSEVRTHLYFALKRAGIPLSIPAQALFVTKETEKRRSLKVTQDLAKRLESIDHVALFRHLQPAERERLVEQLVPAPFAPNDVMIHQGENAQWLYVIVAGHADMVVKDSHGHESRVVSLGPGDVFGEVGLMTGEPRMATVIARTEVECYRLDRLAVQQLLQSRPELAEGFAHLIAEHTTQIEAARQHLGTTTQDVNLTRARHDILSKIRQFFGLVDDSGIEED